MLFRIIQILMLTLIAHTSCAEETSTIIPRDIIFGNPKRAEVLLSPDGKYISYLAPKDGVLNIWVAKRDDLPNAKPITHDKKSGIRTHGWTYDRKHILYIQDNNGDENFCLYAYNIETNKTTQLTSSSKGARVQGWVIREGKPNEVVISYNERDPNYNDLYRISLIDYKKEMIFENHKFSRFVLDNDLTPRFGEAFNNDTGQKEYYKLDGSKYELFTTYSPEESESGGFIGFDKTNSVLYIADSRTTDTLAIKALDLKTNKTKTLYSNKKADVYPASFAPSAWKNIQMLKIDYDKPIYKALDKSFAKDIKYLEGVDSGHFGINTRTADDKLWLVHYYGDTMSNHYYLYDRDKKEVKFLFTSRPELEQYKLTPMTPVVIKSRDGLEMMSYLTMPQNHTKGTTVSMVLYVHGGPVLRDHWGLNPIHQWLANRGYAVLSVNYRGSSGFGKKFTSAGARQWGLKMHDDLIDAVNWAIDKKIADPQKICIMGGSYGGYATLAGLTFTPDVFACGVDIVGISNLNTFMQTMPSYWKGIYGLMKARVGDPDTEEGRADLARRSPVNFADKIKKPLLIGQGANDPRVKQAESDQIVTAMQKNHVPVIYALYSEEGHGFVRPANKISFFAMTEEFLSGVLGGKLEPIGNDFNGANFTLNGKKVNATEADKIIRDNIK